METHALGAFAAGAACEHFCPRYLDFVRPVQATMLRLNEDAEEDDDGELPPEMNSGAMHLQPTTSACTYAHNVSSQEEEEEEAQQQTTAAQSLKAVSAQEDDQFLPLPSEHGGGIETVAWDQPLPTPAGFIGVGPFWSRTPGQSGGLGTLKRERW